MENKCVCCGAIIPEGRQVCPNCESKSNDKLKVGDKVYQFDNAGNMYELTVEKLIYDCGHIAFDEDAIGKTVFLKAEAEKRFKELQNEQD